MKCLVVIAHPIEHSLCQHLAKKTIKHLVSTGYQVTVKDLYEDNFNPVLSYNERASYYQTNYDNSQLKYDINELMETETLVLIFPTWWFGFPAILKGWFDRVWAPGFAYHHASDLGGIKSGLTHLKEMKVITTLGSPWWVDTFILRNPVKRILKIALMGTCSKKCSFQMLSLYNSEKATTSQVEKFVTKITQTF
ncbi:NAD(P)H-dependent oxidoreductase [Colwelliaceae bacterium 6441]